MRGLWKAHRLGKKTRIQSTTGTILCFLFFFFLPSGIPQPGLRAIQYAEVETGHRHSSKRNLLLLIQGVRKRTPNAQRRGNSCVSSFLSILSHPSSQAILPVSGWPQQLRCNRGLHVQKLWRRGTFLSHQRSCGPKMAGQTLLLFFSVLPPLSPGCRGSCTKYVAE